MTKGYNVYKKASRRFNCKDTYKNFLGNRIESRKKYNEAKLEYLKVLKEAEELGVKIDGRYTRRRF